MTALVAPQTQQTTPSVESSPPPTPPYSKTYTEEEVQKEALKYFGDPLPADAWRKKYALRNSEGLLVEKSPTDMHHRLAREFARIEKKYGGENMLSKDEIFFLLDKFKYIVPQGSPMSAVGNPFYLQSASNCFTLSPPNDSYGSILLADQKMAQLQKRRAGVGVDISNLRPKGTPTKNAAVTSDGIGVFIQRFSNTTREVAQGGRRGAAIITLDCRHPEVETFINIKRDRKKVTGANISIKWTDDFLQAVEKDEEYTLHWPVEASVEEAKVTKTVKAKEVWDSYIDAAWDCAEPGALFWDTILREGPADCYASEGFRTVGVNPCFAPGTLIHTREGHFPIEDLVGRTVEVWDGLRWFSCDNFRVTGENQPILRVEMQDGSFERVTPYHTCLLEDGTRLKARDLKVGMKLKRSEAPLSHGTITESGAYLKGFLCRDGTSQEEKILLYLHQPKHICMDRLKASCLEMEVENVNTNAKSAIDFGEEASNGTRLMQGLSVRKSTLLPWVKEHRHRLPKEIFSWDLESKCAFIAGVLDADGTAQDSPSKGFRYQISSIHKDWLYGFQTLLKTIGVPSKLSIMKKGGKKDFGKRGGVCEVQDCWRLTISQIGSIALAKQVSFSRLTSFAEKHMKRIMPDKSAQVVAVHEDGVEETVYCCTVETTHSLALSSGNHWGNCGEITLSSEDSCRLLLLNLMGFVVHPYTKEAYFDYEAFHQCALKAMRLMDDLVDLEIECVDRIIEKIEADPETAEEKAVELRLWKRIRDVGAKGRRTGLGITALGDCIAALGHTYGSKWSLDITEEIYSSLAVAAETGSCLLAEERGTFPVFDREKEKDNPYLNRVWKESPSVKMLWNKHGRRNISPTTTAPTGTSSMVSLVFEDDDIRFFSTTSGIESVAVSLETKRRRKLQESEDDTPDYVDEMGDRWKEYDVYHAGVQAWQHVTGESDVEKSPYWGATSNDIDWETSVELQARAQKWISHSISKTCNLPRDVSKEVVDKCYMRAWKSGCKGFTVYREGSRDAVIFSAQAADPRDAGEIVYQHAPKRPDVLPCEIHQISVKGEKWVVLVGLLEGRPYEVFGGLSASIEIPRRAKEGTLLKHPKKGKAKLSTYDLTIGEGEEALVLHDVASLFDNPTQGSFTRMVSLSLRHGAPIQFIVEQLQRDKYSDITSFSAGLARVLKKYIQDGTESASAKSCEQCGATPLTYQEGCITCRACGWSKC